MVNKKLLAGIVILIIIVGFIAYIVYSQLKPIEIKQLKEDIKAYVGLYFLSSRIIVPLPFTNSTKTG